MSLQIIALLVMVISFSVLVIWVYWPGNATRMDAASRLPFEAEPAAHSSTDEDA